MSKTVVGLYDSAERARDTMNALVDAGCPRDDISLLARDTDTTPQGAATVEHHGDEEAISHAPEGIAAGAGIGAILGGVGGALAGLGMLAIPGLGPLMAAGPLAAGLAGAASGAMAGGVVGGLIGLGIPEEEAHAYAEGVRRGKTLVTVRAPDHQASNYADIMNRFHPLNIKTHAAEWMREGWSGRYEHPEQEGAASDQPAYGATPPRSGVVAEELAAERAGIPADSSADQPYVSGTARVQEATEEPVIPGRARRASDEENHDQEKVDLDKLPPSPDRPEPRTHR